MVTLWHESCLVRGNTYETMKNDTFSLYGLDIDVKAYCLFSHIISRLYSLYFKKKKIVMDRGLWKWFPLFSCLNSFYLTFLKRSLGEKRNLGCKWIERWWVVQMLLNRTCEWISFLFLLMWAIKPVMQAFDVALHCLAELQEIENEDQESVSEGEKRRRTGLTCSPSGFSGTQHTEMN